MLVELKILRAIARCADSESSRYALGGVLLERLSNGDCVAIATDDRQLAAYAWREPEELRQTPAAAPGWSAIVSLESIELARKTYSGHTRAELAKQPRRAWLDIQETESADMAVFGFDKIGPRQLMARRIEGRFTKWRDVIPEPGTRYGTRVTLNPHYLASVASVAIDCIVTDDRRGVTFHVRDHDHAIVVEANQENDSRRFYHVLMPLASDNYHVTPMIGRETAPAAPVASPAKRKRQTAA